MRKVAVARVGGVTGALAHVELVGVGCVSIHWVPLHMKVEWNEGSDKQVAKGAEEALL